MRRLLILVYLVSFGLIFSVNLQAAKYAILISGDATDADDEPLNSEFWYDLFLAYEDLIIKEGFTHDNVYVCYGDGTSFNSNHNRFKLSLHGWPEIVDYDNKKETILSLFDYLGNRTTDADHILIRWVAGHGRTTRIDTTKGTGYSKDDYRAMISNRNDSVFDTELIEHIENIDHYNHKLILWATCHSGCLLTGEKRLDGPATMVMTACQWYERSFGMDPRIDLYHVIFNFYATGFLYGSVPTVGYGADRSVNIDFNSDGFITMDELFENVLDSAWDVWQHAEIEGCEGFINNLVIGGILRLFLLNRNIDYSGNFEAYRSITAAGGKTYCVLENDANVTMKAGEYILLTDGFYAKEGCFLDASIDQIGAATSTALSLPGKTMETTKDSTSDEILIEIDKYKERIPTEFSCNQNHPNPFASSTTIRYGLPVDADVSLCIYNLLGQRVKTVNMKQSPGYKSFVWDRTDDAGNVVGSGIYFYVLEAGDKFRANRKMLVLR